MSPPNQIPQGWRPLGPFCIPHGQTEGAAGFSPLLSVSGRVTAVAADPAHSGHLVIGASRGGIWETFYDGATWAPRGDDQPTTSIGAVVFDPHHSNVVYAGTGVAPWIPCLGAGVLRSDDNGTTWQRIASSPFTGVGFYALVVDPLTPRHLLAATSDGLYDSADGGESWQQRRTGPTFSLSIRLVDGAVEVLSGSSSGIVRSADAGQTWGALTLPGAPGLGFGRSAVCHAPSDPGVAYVAAVGQDSAIYLWRRATSTSPFVAVPAPVGLTDYESEYHWVAAVAPNDADTLYLGSVDLYRGTGAANGTWSWETISSRTIGPSIHPDQHSIAFDPVAPDTIYVGCDGGVYRSPDRGENWTSLNKGLCTVEFEFIAAHPQLDAWLIGGTQDNGTLRYEGQECWLTVAGGDGGDCGVAAISPSTCYATGVFLGVLRSATGGGSNSWTILNTPQHGGTGCVAYPPLAVCDNVVAQGGLPVFVSRNFGDTWEQVTLPVTNQAVSALAFPTADRAYAGTRNGQLYRLDYDGVAWLAPTTLPLPSQGFRWISDILVDPGNLQRIWVTYADASGDADPSAVRVYRSDDGGNHWIPCDTNLPVGSGVNSIEIDPATNAVFVATDAGVYRSDSAGTTWQPFNSGLPNARAKDLHFHEASRLLRVVLQNRGVWEIAVDQALMPDVEVYLRDSTVDTGRVAPSPSGVTDPFTTNSVAFWWQSVDIKLDVPPFQASSPVDFEFFQDDHGWGYAGLLDRSGRALGGTSARLYVQVHNRGVKPATNVIVKAYFTDAALGLPDLPQGFWTNFPSNSLPLSSLWHEITPAQSLPAPLQAGHPQVVRFDWEVPISAARHTCVVVIVTADNDMIDTTETRIAALVTGCKKVAQKNLTVVNAPQGGGGPPIRWHLLTVWGVGDQRPFSLGADPGAERLIAGLVLGSRLSAMARHQGLPSRDIADPEREALTRLTSGDPRLAERLDHSVLFTPPHARLWLKDARLPQNESEPVAVLLHATSTPGYASLVQYAEDGTTLGGYTLALHPSRPLTQSLLGLKDLD